MNEFERQRLKNKILHEQYGGDQDRMDKADAKTLHEGMYFDDILSEATILPELEEQGKQVINAMLGFVPDYYITVTHEPYIRGILNSYRMGMLTEQQFYDAIEESVIPMRNAFMFEHCDVAYPPDIYSRYNDLPDHQKSAAIGRITKLLGYEPDIGSAISAIISLADTMHQDTRRFPEYLTPADYQVMQIIKYREVLLSKGKDAADKSPLPLLESLNTEAFPKKVVHI